jgi:uncharacterized protein YndB with AHSA1/START domain/DNA-binding transcriptional ArsR family regulator
VSEDSPIVPHVDVVFGALNDQSRRYLLDELFARDGQTLGELCAYLPQMTRFGVMNHLGVLEEAGLISTHKEGRRKLHYLNPVPIRLVHDRWISKYTEPTANALTRLKAQVEGGTVSEPTHVYQIYINADPATVWQAIVDGEQTRRYFYGTRVESTWAPDAGIRYLGADGRVVADGKVIVVEPCHLLEITFQAHWDPELEAEGPAREVWLLEDVNGATKLTVEMHDVAPGSKTYEDFTGGFPYILSGLKTFVETGESLPSPH